MHGNGINLYFSHSVERLVDALSMQLQHQQSTQPVFEAPKVLVPNANMQRFLQLSLASKNGVCAHIDFPFLETGLFQIVNDLGQFKQQQLNGQLLSWLILGLLKSEDVFDNVYYQPIRNYLNDQESNQLRATKLWQLSRKLAVLLLDYESQRPEMVDAWSQGKLVFPNSHDLHLQQLEKMQQHLYGEITAISQNHQLSTLYQLGRELQQSQIDTTEKPIHLFTPSRLSQLHRQLIIQLGQWLPIHIYQLNVCVEYWEDMQTDGEVRWCQTKLKQLQKLKVELRDEDGQFLEANQHRAESFAELAHFADENPLLRAWGKPGREALKLFSEIENDAIHSSIKYHDHWLLPEELTQQSLLHLLQFNVLQREPNQQKITDLAQLKSLQMAAAPSIYREVEAVYNNILWNLKQDERLLQNDIALLVTDMNKYRFVIEQVFESLNQRCQTQLQYAIVDSSAATESRYAEAVLDLFKVLDDDFIRASVFKWLDNSCVKAANQFDDKDWFDWLMAVEHLGIYCGYDQLYAATAERKDIEKLFTWEQGLQRLHRTLAVMDEDTEQLSFLDAARIGQFSVLIETLYQFKKQNQQPKTVRQWEQQLNRMFDLLLAMPADEPREQYVQLALQQSLLKLANTQADLVLSYADIKQFIQHELKQIPASKGSYLTGGVVCAALQPMRPIPFKITYVLGMDETTFPGQLQKETLDLTNRSRRIGDINVVENKNYLFLETLMCTREKLYLSYVSQDLQKDEVIEPSPVLLTLKSACEDLLDLDQLAIEAFPIVKLPLDASDGFETDHVQNSFSDWMVNFSYTDLLLYCEKNQLDNYPQPNNAIHQQQWELFKNNTGKIVELVESESSKTATSTEIIEIDASQLADFLINPQAAILKKQGILSKHPEDVSLIDSEPQDISGLIKHRIFVASIEDWLENPQTANFNQLLEQHHKQQLLKSKAPVDLFANLEMFDGIELQLEEQLKPQVVNSELIGSVRVGDSKVQEQPGLSVKGVKLQLDDGQQVIINGLAEHVFADNKVLSGQVVISSGSKDSQWNSKLAKPFINWCLWQLTEDIPVQEPFVVNLVFPKKVHQVELKPWLVEDDSFSTKTDIGNYLKALVTDYLNEQSIYLPLELLTQLKVPKKQTEAKLPLLAPNSKAQWVNYLAFDFNELDETDFQLIGDKYLSSTKWPSHEEILKLVEFKLTEHPADAYRKHLLPLFAMVHGHFNEASGDQ